MAEVSPKGGWRTYGRELGVWDPMSCRELGWFQMDVDKRVWDATAIMAFEDKRSRPDGDEFNINLEMEKQATGRGRHAD